MGTHLRVLRKSYPMNTSMTGLRCFSKIFASFCFEQNERSLSIGKVNGLILILYSHILTTLFPFLLNQIITMGDWSINAGAFSFSEHATIDLPNNLLGKHQRNKKNTCTLT